jgi:CO/xanthine dehydrogenase Mo-binding subunit
MLQDARPWISAAHLDRRCFLKSGGSLVLAFGLRTSLAAAADFVPVPANQLDSWIAIAENGKVTAFTGRIDMGTGTQTVYCQAIAEELDIPVHSVSVVMGDTARTPEQGKSTASDSVTLNLKPMRQAAAEARGVLLNLAAEKLGVPREQLATADGAAFVKGQPNKKATYGQLIGGRMFLRELVIKGEAQSTEIIGNEVLKARGDFTVRSDTKPAPTVACTPSYLQNVAKRTAAKGGTLDAERPGRCGSERPASGNVSRCRPRRGRSPLIEC